MPAPLLVVMLALTPAAGPEPHDVALAKCQEYIEGHLKLVAAGETNQAVEFVRVRSKNPDLPAEQVGEFRRLLAGVFASAGTFEGHDFAGFKRLTPRSYVLYAAVYGSKTTHLFTYVFERSGGEWKLTALRVKPNLDDLEPLAPYTPPR